MQQESALRQAWGIEKVNYIVIVSWEEEALDILIRREKERERARASDREHYQELLHNGGSRVSSASKAVLGSESLIQLHQTRMRTTMFTFLPKWDRGDGKTNPLANSFFQ